MSGSSLEYLEPRLAGIIVEAYEGELDEHDNYSGKGDAKTVDGSSYVGMFLNGVFHGKGKYKWANEVTYVGDFLEGTITGSGVYTWPDGSSYRGDVRSGKRHGNGVFKCSAGQLYDGEWCDGFRHGNGTASYEEGKSTTVYSGEWYMGKRQGYGKMQYASGNLYEGNWYADKKCGKGVMKWIADQSTYAGEWENDLPNGSGETLWANLKMSRLVTKQMSSVYRGTMKDGRKEGNGSFIYADGSQYSGEWNRDVKHGEGVVILGNGAMESTSFDCGRRMNEPVVKTAIDSPLTPGKKKDAAKKVKGESPSQVSAAGNKELKLNLVDIVGILPVIDTSTTDSADLPMVYVDKSSLAGIESELERIVMRYQAVLRKVYHSLTSSSKLETRKEVMDELTGNGKGNVAKSSQFGAMDSAIASSVVKHQAYLCTSLNRFKAYARELGITNEAYSSKDLSSTYDSMIAYRHKSAEETYIKSHKSEDGQPVQPPKLHTILGETIGPTDLTEEGRGMEIPIPELDFVNLLVRCSIESISKKSNADKSATRLDDEPMQAPMTLQEVVRAALDSVQRNWEAKAELSEEQAALNTPATQSLLRGEKASFFKDLWAQISNGASSVELRKAMKLFMQLRDAKVIDASVTTSALLDIIRGIKRLLPDVPALESRPVTAASEVPAECEGESEAAAEPSAEETSEPVEEKVVAPAPPASVLPPLAAMSSFSVLTKRIDFDDFLELLCMIVLSDKWVGVAIVEAAPTEGAGGEGEEKQETPAEEAPTEGGEATEAAAEPAPEPEPEKTLPEVLQERLALFSSTYVAPAE